MTDITLLDGGMGQELIHRSGDNPTPLWSTQVMIDNPGMVADVHRDFTQAGATLATANTYATGATHSIDLVDENNTRSLLLSLLEHVTNTRGTDTDEHFDEVRTGN